MSPFLVSGGNYCEIISNQRMANNMANTMGVWTQPQQVAGAIFTDFIGTQEEVSAQ